MGIVRAAKNDTKIFLVDKINKKRLKINIDKYRYNGKYSIL